MPRDNYRTTRPFTGEVSGCNLWLFDCRKFPVISSVKGFLFEMKKFYNESELVFTEKSTVYNFDDLTGRKFGRIIILGFAGNRMWFCKCDCGKITKVFAGSLKDGTTNSCGCFMRERAREANIEHGHTINKRRTPTHKTWQGMLERCNNPNSIRFYDYGGRGIKVCERWLKFENFLEDMGERPKNTTIERKENNKGYYKENCRWATVKEQCNNRRSNHFLTFNEKTQTMAQWADEIEISSNTICMRLRSGWSVEKALTTPVKTTKMIKS